MGPLKHLKEEKQQHRKTEKSDILKAKFESFFVATYATTYSILLFFQQEDLFGNRKTIEYKMLAHLIIMISINYFKHSSPWQPGTNYNSVCKSFTLNQ